MHISVPRVCERVFKKEMKKKVTPAWDIDKSLFKEHHSLTEELIGECFEFDWATMQRPKLKGGTAHDVVKSILKKTYALL